MAGGKNTRLYPIMRVVSKLLLAIYDKSMIYYPLSVIILADIRKILIFSDPRNLPFYQEVLGDGSHIGLKLSYKVLTEPRGLADAFIVGEKFTAGDKVALILGDNIFCGRLFSDILAQARSIEKGAIIFRYYVNNPEEFGVLEFDENFSLVSLEEKPTLPKSNYVIPGLYFYDERVVEFAKSLKPSVCGEIEITGLNRKYLERGELKVQLLGRGFAWLDTGTYDGLANATDFVRTIQKRTGLYISCIEEIAYLKRFITKDQIIKLGNYYSRTEYGKYILKILLSNLNNIKNFSQING